MLFLIISSGSFKELPQFLNLSSFVYLFTQHKPPRLFPLITNPLLIPHHQLYLFQEASLTGQGQVKFPNPANTHLHPSHKLSDCASPTPALSPVPAHSSITLDCCCLPLCTGSSMKTGSRADGHVCVPKIPYRRASQVSFFFFQPGILRKVEGRNAGIMS